MDQPISMTETAEGVETADAAESPTDHSPPSLIGGPFILGSLLVVLGIFMLMLGRRISKPPLDPAATAATSAETPTPTTASTPIPNGVRIDINVATENEISLVPGVGTVLAKRIIISRQQDGPFQSMEDLSRVHGIGGRTLQRISAIAFVRHAPSWQRETGPTERPSTGRNPPRLANR